MQVSIESLEGLERKMTVEIPVDAVINAVGKKLKDLTKTVRVDGFRPGKVPLKVMQQKYGEPVRQEVISDLIESSYRDAVTQENIRPAGMPAIELVNANAADTEAVSYTATFEVFPEIENFHLDLIQIEQPEAEISDADYDAMIEKLRHQRKEWVETERCATTGNQVVVDFEGYIDGKIFEGGSGSDVVIEIGAGQMLPEFEAGLDGMSASEEKTIEVNFPEDYHGEAVRGKTAMFSLRVSKVSAFKLPDVDTEFIKAFGVDNGDFEKFHSDVRNNMEKELNQRIKQMVKKSVLEALLAVNNVIAPSAMVAEEIKMQKNAAIQRMGQDPANFDSSNLPDELFREVATKRVQTGLLIGELIKNEEIEVEHSRVEDMLNGIAVSYEDPEQVKAYYRQNSKAKASLEAAVLEEQAIEHILSKATITQKSYGFNEIMDTAV